MPAELIDGIAVARSDPRRSGRGVLVQKARGVVPGLAVVLVGEDPASAVYVRNKGRACEEAGMHSVTIRMPAETTQAELLAVVDQLNADPAIHGMLVQMPLPKQCNAEEVIRRIDPAKDVDGFHPINAGKLIIGETDGFAPCTPAGVIELLKRYGVKTRWCGCGDHRPLEHRGQADGEPAGAAGRGRDGDHLPQPHATSRRTRVAPTSSSPPSAAPKFVTADMVKPGATVIDVGINRVDEPRAKNGYILAGDVDFASRARGGRQASRRCRVAWAR